MIKRILVGIGGTEYTDVAIERALEMAKIYDAVVTGVTVVDLKRLQRVGPVPLGGAAYADKLRKKRTEITRERIDQALAKCEDGCRKSGIACNIGQEAGDPFELMISHARYNDITIFGLRSLFDYGFTPEPRDALIRLVSQGIRPIIAVSPKYRAIRRVLVAYNGSMESAEAMRRYVQMRPWSDASLRIVFFGDENAEALELLEDASEYCQAHGLAAETAVVPESAKTGLVTYARENGFDLIVMGNSSRSILMRQIIGDTVLNTIQQADRPLFLAQ
jgi:nucleotide-binding universal stress UspA family protein